MTFGVSGFPKRDETVGAQHLTAGFAPGDPATIRPASGKRLNDPAIVEPAAGPAESCPCDSGANIHRRVSPSAPGEHAGREGSGGCPPRSQISAHDAEYRKRWMAGIPPEFRKKDAAAKARKYSNEAAVKKAKSRREEMIPKIRRMRLEQAMPTVDIARALGVGKVTVQRIIKEEGLPDATRRKSVTRKAWADKRAALAPKLRELHAQGLSVPGIAARLGVNPQTARRIMREGGIEPNNINPNSKPITFMGVEYPTYVAAEQATGIGRTTIRRRIANGRG